MPPPHAAGSTSPAAASSPHANSYTRANIVAVPTTPVSDVTASQGNSPAHLVNSVPVNSTKVTDSVNSEHLMDSHAHHVNSVPVNSVRVTDSVNSEHLIDGADFCPLPDGAVTPIDIDKFESCLATHPDQQTVEYLCHGLRNGFDIGFQDNACATQPRNLRSALDYPEDVSKAILKEVKNKHTAGPFATPPIPNLHCSPLGSREKKDGSRRLIMDLSQPKGLAINEGIDKEQFPVKYSHFDEATDMVYREGKNALMSKIDVKHAFRLLPVLPIQWILLGICWLGQFFVDTRLPFGLRSSPAIFNKFADALWWIIRNIFNVPNIIHYSDDFLLVSPSTLSVAKYQLQTVLSAFNYLKVPTAPEKTVGPSTKVVYLGILIDSANMTIQIPPDKLHELTTILPTWLHRKKCTKRDLLSLIGKLSFACKVIRPGRIFLRRLIDVSTKVDRLHHHIDLDSEARADIKWWVDNIHHLNREATILQPDITLNAHLMLYTDASDLGLGAIFGGKWIQSSWPYNISDTTSIDYRELLAIIASCLTWGHHWRGKRILIYTDNQPITDIWAAGTSKSKQLMALTRSLYSITVRHKFTVHLWHIPGLDNPISDALSRFQDRRFRQLHPHADPVQSRIPPEFWDIIKSTCSL